MTSLRTVVALLLGPMLVSACSVFDPSLVPEEDAVAEIQFADECFVDQLPVITESTSVIVDLAEYKSAGLGFPLCPGDIKEFPGEDVYFKLRAEPGERWNINAAPQKEDHDVVVLNLGSGCTPTGCKTVQNRCDVGFHEDSAIINRLSETVEYVIAVDSVTGTGPVQITLDKSMCGNGIVEAGETCDEDSDSCDIECRRVIESGDDIEGEPNDIFTGVDMIGDGESDTLVRLRGSVAGPCDEDHYAFIVPEGANIAVRMFGPTGGPCAPNSGIDLPFVDFLAAGKPAVQGKGVIIPTQSSGNCPFIDGIAEPGTYMIENEDGEMEEVDFSYARDVEASEYHLIINAFNAPDVIDYTIEFEIEVP